MLKILDGLPGNINEIKNMGKVDMFELFVKNVNQMKSIIDREEDQDSEKNNSYSSGYDTNRKKTKSMISSVVDESDDESDISIIEK